MSHSLLTVLHASLDVEELRPALELTPHDRHFRQGYRFRSMSRFEIVDGNPPFERLEPKPLFQSGAINPIENYGGIYRDYSELPDALVEARDFRMLVKLWLEAIPEPCSRFSIHHIRTLAPGAPTPEGRHRDGYEYVGIGVLQRRDLDRQSAVTRFWNRDEEGLVFEEVLDEGDLVVFDDRRHLHETSDVHVAANARAGVRDVLIFTVPDHGAISEHYEVR